MSIRCMQFLAILDAEVVVFVDGQYKNWVEIVWQNFRPGERMALDEPVPYAACYYQPDGRQTMARLQGEFHKALQAVATKGKIEGPARLLKFSKDSR